jgi:hypothetical protein
MKGEDVMSVSEFKNTREFFDWASGYVLSRFVEEGGQGMRNALYVVCETYRKTRLRQ